MSSATTISIRTDIAVDRLKTHLSVIMNQYHSNLNLNVYQKMIIILYSVKANQILIQNTKQQSFTSHQL